MAGLEVKGDASFEILSERESQIKLARKPSLHSYCPNERIRIIRSFVNRFRMLVLG